MRRKLFLILSLMLLLALVIGCAASSPIATTADQNRGQSTAATTTYGSSPQDGSSNEKNTAGAGATIDAERKIIRNASMRLEAKDAADTYDKLLAFAASHGGYEFRRTQYSSDGDVSIDAQIKIKPEHLTAFMDYAKTLATVLEANTTSEEITEIYYDAQTRLKTMETTLVIYYDFLEKAKDMDEILQVQRMIDNLTLDIESLKGKLRLWDSLMAESVISLYIREIPKPYKVEVKRDASWTALKWNDMLKSMKNGLIAVASKTVMVLQYLVIFLVNTSPLWVIALIVLLIVFLRKRHLRKKAMAARAVELPPARQAGGQPPAENTSAGPEG